MLTCDSAKSKMAVGVVFCIWLAILLIFCKVWKKYVDVLGVRFSVWAEELVLGKRDIEMPIGESLQHFWKTRSTLATEKFM